VRAVFRFRFRVQSFAIELAIGSIAILPRQAAFELAEAVSNAVLGATLLVRRPRPFLAVLIEIDDIAHDAPPPAGPKFVAFTATNATD
jgi:hypothetical protein